MTIIIVALHKYQPKILIISRSVFPRMRNFLDIFVEKFKIYNWSWINSFLEICEVCEIMVYNILRTDIIQITVWPVWGAFWPNEGCNSMFWIWNICLFSTSTMVVQTHLNITLQYIVCSSIIMCCGGSKHCNVG